MSLDDGASTDTPPTESADRGETGDNGAQPTRRARTTAAQRIAEASETTGRERLYRQHIFSAHHFAELSQVLEGRGADDLSTEEKRRHRAYVIGSISSAS
jgi:hypothetical protein